MPSTRLMSSLPMRRTSKPLSVMFFSIEVDVVEHQLRLLVFGEPHQEQELPGCGHLDLLGFQVAALLFQDLPHCRIFFLPETLLDEPLVIVKPLAGVQAGDLQARMGGEHHEQMPDFNLHIGMGQHRDIGRLHKKNRQLPTGGLYAIVCEPLQAQQSAGGVAFFPFSASSAAPPCIFLLTE